MLSSLESAESIADSLASRVESSESVVRLTPEQAARAARVHATLTEFGAAAFFTHVRSRSASKTLYIGPPEVRQKELTPDQLRIAEELDATLERVSSYLAKAPLVLVERRMGQNSQFSPLCRLYVSVENRVNVRLAYMFSTLMFDPEGATGPELTLIDAPEWPETQILVFPEQRLTLVLGSDYFGEVKKGFLRMGMWEAKKRGMLGLHAGAKLVRVRRDGRLQKILVILFGLSGTGKTTHTCHTHFLSRDGEGVEMIQDDVIFLRRNGSFLGTENAFFVKTEGLSPEVLPQLYDAVMRPNVIFENVAVDWRGRVHLDDYSLTSNGRAVVPRENLGKYASSYINVLDPSELDGIAVIFITRRFTVVPIAARLTPEQAAAAFMLGESVITSAADPKRAGQSVREVGTNPFIIGDPAYEGNWMYEFFRRHEDTVSAYVVNTGGVGEVRQNGRVVKPALRVQIPEMARIIAGMLRGEVRWRRDPLLGVEVAEAVPGVDLSKFNPARHYDWPALSKLVAELKDERREWLSKFPGLRRDVLEARY